MSVVHYLGNVIASCTHLASMLESGQVEGGLEEPITGKTLKVLSVCRDHRFSIDRTNICSQKRQCQQRLPSTPHLSSVSL